VARRLAPGALLLAFLGVIVVIAVTRGGAMFTLRAQFVAALQVRPGQAVRIAGRQVGSVQNVALADGAALVTLGIDGNAWPLHAGTVAELRYGAAASYASRYVALHPGPSGNPALADGALLPEADTITPTEFDQVYSMFDRRTRENFGGTLAGAATLLHDEGAAITSGLDGGSSGTQRTADMLGDLGVDPTALSSLVTSGAATFGALRSTDPQLQDLVGNAAQTFSVFADNAAALQASIAKFPGTLTTSQATLAKLDQTLTPLRTLVDDVAPGAASLVTTAPLLTKVLTTLDRVGPLTIRTLTDGRTDLPLLTSFLDKSDPFLPKLTESIASLGPMVACVRPYAPEIGGYLGT
jgi:phospholipid/cholesterol/gamma-HCH transport system substrate-binding protein